MNTSDTHNENKFPADDFLKNGDFAWKKDKNEIWNDLQQQIKYTKKAKSRTLTISARFYSLAASLVVLLGITAFLRFYTIEINTPVTEHQQINLPDGSVVLLNAKSKINYRPYWWQFRRNIKLVGEAYFEVKKGKRFKVITPYGKTEVLGTSFNIFARDSQYKVTCVTGSVKVSSLTAESVILNPNTRVEISQNGNLEYFKNINAKNDISWKNNLFNFNATPVYFVFQELERQYGVKINSKIDSSIRYSGNFSREIHVELVLDYICPALGLTYSKEQKTYTITMLE